ncbi:MAG: hypothetical protein U1E15_13845 [Hyphomicrobiales bacterium]
MAEGYAIRAARDEADMSDIRKLLLEYWQSLGADPAFQNFEADLATLPGVLPRPC